MSDFFSGGSGKVTSSSTVDPTQANLNNLFAQEALGLRGVSGGVPAFGTSQPGLYGLGPTEDLFRRQIIAATSDPGAYPQVLQRLFERGNTLSDFTGEMMDWSLRPVAGPTDVEAINTLRGFLDPEALLGKAGEYMRTIGEPTARAASVAGGMGGVKGGAFQEGLARESARMALPILQSIPGYASQLFNMGTGLESRALGRRGFAGNLALQGGAAERDFARLLPLIDQHRLAMLTAGQAAAAQPRMEALKDFLRQQDIVMSTLLRVPVRTGVSETKQVREDLTAKDFIGPLSSIWAASLLGPRSSSGLSWT